ncbi:MAG: hypothetical protein A2Y12_04830 [Planctomycetes bacterium GWF2_42_9]|nr:MAG: hypothetical protein A2Y12_04830 [Planctomycetes bacterium GWF2_42_9]
MKKMLSCMILAIAGTGFCSVAMGTVLLSDDFEGATAAAFPTLSADADPIATAGTWTVVEQRSGISDSFADIQVTNNAAPGAPVGGGSNYLGVQRYTSGYANIHGNLATAATGTVTLDYDMYVVANNVQTSAGPRIWFRDTTGTTGTAGLTSSDYAFELASDFYQPNGASGQLWHYNSVATGNPTRTILGAYGLNQWVHVRYVFDLVAQNYNLTVGATTYSNLSFIKPLTQIQQVAWQCGQASSPAAPNFYLDNVILTPEPMTLALLGLGSFALLRKK